MKNCLLNVLNFFNLGFSKLIKLIYLYFVVLPQGVRGYFIDFVRPPCGWSTGFLATPRTIDLQPHERQYPALVLLKYFLKGSDT
jgi:hypothetical protein